MKVTYSSSGNFEETMSWLKDVKMDASTSMMNQIGRSGVNALSNATPIGDTGDTSRGWDYVVETNRSGVEVYFVNRAHPELPVSIAKLIELGHGTRNGGYVPPHPYIKRAIGPILDEGANRLVKEMIK